LRSFSCSWGLTRFLGFSTRTQTIDFDRIPCPIQGATVRPEYGDATTTIDPACANVVAEAFPRTFGQRLVSFLAADKPVEERPPIRSGSKTLIMCAVSRIDRLRPSLLLAGWEWCSRGGSRLVGTTSSGASLTLSKRTIRRVCCTDLLVILQPVSVYNILSSEIWSLWRS
jgi:hypothetical protein